MSSFPHLPTPSSSPPPIFRSSSSIPSSSPSRSPPPSPPPSTRVFALTRRPPPPIPSSPFPSRPAQNYPAEFDEEREKRWERAMELNKPLEITEADLPHDLPSPNSLLPVNTDPVNEGKVKQESTEKDEDIASDDQPAQCQPLDPLHFSSSIFCRQPCSAGDAHLHFNLPTPADLPQPPRCPRHQRLRALSWMRKWITAEEWDQIARREAPPSTLEDMVMMEDCQDCRTDEDKKPVLAALPPSIVLSHRTAIQCLATAGGEKFPEKLIYLPASHTADLPLLLPYATLRTQPASDPQLPHHFSLHLALDLPFSSPPASSGFQLYSVDVDDLYVNLRWKEDETKRDLHPLESHQPVSSPVQPTIRMQHNGGIVVSHSSHVTVSGLTVRVAAKIDSADCNWEEVNIQWESVGGHDEYRLQLRPLFIRGAELNPISMEVDVAELHWSEMGEVRRGVKRARENVNQPDSTVASASQLTPLQWEDADESEEEYEQADTLSLTTQPTAPDSSDSDDDPQMASTSPSAPLSFPFLPDSDYLHSRRIESTLLYHFREASVFQGGNEWIQCDACSAYRRLPDWVRMDELPSLWVCRMNPNLLMDECGKGGEEQEMGKRGDWCDDVCAICEQGEKAMVAGFGGWQREDNYYNNKREIEPSAQLLSFSTTSSSSSSTSLKPPPARPVPSTPLTSSPSSSTAFPLVSIPPLKISNPLIGCSGPCSRSFHVSCISLDSPILSPTHRRVDREWYCSDCRHSRGVCFVCGLKGSEGVDLKRCGAVCGKMYHIACMPQLWTYHRKMRQRFRETAAKEKKERVRRRAAKDEKESEEDDELEDELDEGDVSLFVCPRHWCAACGESGEDRILLRCLRCPVAYHCSAPCRPVHIQLVTERTFICSKHAGEPQKESTTQKDGKKRKRNTLSMSTSHPPRHSRFPHWIRKAESREAALGLKVSLNTANTSPQFPSILAYQYPEMPLRLSNDLVLLSLGRVVSDRPAFHLEWAIFPVGYKVLRTVHMINREDVSVTLLCEILDGTTCPVFRISPVFMTRVTSAGETVERLNKKSKDESVNDRFIDNVWNKVERAWLQWTKQKYTPDQFPIKDAPNVSSQSRSKIGMVGCARFGLLLPQVIKLIEAMPQVADCERYRGKKGPEEVIDLTSFEDKQKEKVGREESISPFPAGSTRPPRPPVPPVIRTALPVPFHLGMVNNRSTSSPSQVAAPPPQPMPNPSSVHSEKDEREDKERSREDKRIPPSSPSSPSSSSDKAILQSAVESMQAQDMSKQSAIGDKDAAEPRRNGSSSFSAVPSASSTTSSASAASSSSTADVTSVISSTSSLSATPLSVPSSRPSAAVPAVIGKSVSGLHSSFISALRLWPSDEDNVYVYDARLTANMPTPAELAELSRKPTASTSQNDNHDRLNNKEENKQSDNNHPSSSSSSHKSFLKSSVKQVKEEEIDQHKGEIQGTQNGSSSAFSASTAPSSSTPHVASALSSTSSNSATPLSAPCSRPNAAAPPVIGKPVSSLHSSFISALRMWPSDDDNICAPTPPTASPSVHDNHDELNNKEEAKAGDSNHPSSSSSHKSFLKSSVKQLKEEEIDQQHSTGGKGRTEGTQKGSSLTECSASSASTASSSSSARHLASAISSTFAISLSDTSDRSAPPLPPWTESVLTDSLPSANPMNSNLRSKSSPPTDSRVAGLSHTNPKANTSLLPSESKAHELPKEAIDAVKEAVRKAPQSLNISSSSSPLSSFPDVLSSTEAAKLSLRTTNMLTIPKIR